MRIKFSNKSFDDIFFGLLRVTHRKTMHTYSRLTLQIQGCCSKRAPFSRDQQRPASLPARLASASPFSRDQHLPAACSDWAWSFLSLRDCCSPRASPPEVSPPRAGPPTPPISRPG